VQELICEVAIRLVVPVGMTPQQAPADLHGVRAGDVGDCKSLKVRSAANTFAGIESGDFRSSPVHESVAQFLDGNRAGGNTWLRMNLPVLRVARPAGFKQQLVRNW